MGFFLIHGYIDPGSGSFLLQILLAFILGALFTIKGAWRRLKERIKKAFRKGNEEEKQ